jgi:SAM-dependent methyltransferase
MRLAERLLLSLSHTPPPRDKAVASRNVEHALDEALVAFPDLIERIRGRRVLDFGSGFGLQSVALGMAGAAEVLGVEISQDGLAHGRALAREHGVEDRVRFTEAIGNDEHGRFDAVLSLNSMEHFSDPDHILDLMRSALHPQGEMLISFAPPWYAPYGGHMAYFTKVPWVHLLFSERTVMSVRSRFRNDGATRYEEIDGGLNRMSLAKFERLVRAKQLRPRMRHYEAVKGLPAVGRVPVLRELLVNRVTCALQPDPAARSR